MVFDGFSIQMISRYLHRFVLWWVNTAKTWTYEELLIYFKNSCWDKGLANIAEDLLIKHSIKKALKTSTLRTQAL